MSAIRLGAAALSSASVLALATPALAVTSNQPRIQGYADFGSDCGINYSYRVTGTENDVAINDVYQEQLVDSAQTTITTRPLRSVQNGLSNSVTTQIFVQASQVTAASGARGAPFVAIYDTDAAGTRQGLQGSIQVDLAQMSAAGGQCAQVAQAFGFGTNSAPVSDAGPDRSVTAGSIATLNGSGSSDPDGDTLTYSWAQISGPNAAILSPNSPATNVQTPANAPGLLVFELTVTDPSGATSTDRVSVQATGAIIVNPINSAPIARAGADMNVNAGQTSVTLDASASSDPDGDTLTYAWTQTAGPTATLRNGTSAVANFDVPASATGGQTLEFQVEVTDPSGATSTDTVVFTVSGNTAPVADAGPDQSVEGGTQVTLDAGGSSDADGDTLTYSWTQTSGPSVQLDGASTATPSFTAPPGTASAQALVFEVTVNDGTATTTDSVTITVEPNARPVADAGPDQGPVNSGQTVALDGSGSSDADGDTLTYTWRQTGGPSVQLSNASSSRPSFLAPDVSGTQALTFELIVSDGQVDSVADTVQITVRGLGSVTIIQRVVGPDLAVSYTSNIPGLPGSVQTSGGTGTITSGNIAAGSYSFSIADRRAAGYALTALTCNDTDSVVSLANASVAVALSPSENLVCTATLSDTRGAAQQAIGEFVGGRSAALLASEPSLTRRLDRLKGQAASGGSAMIDGAAIPGSGKLPIQLNVSGNNRTASTSLAMARASVGDYGERGGLDIWAQGSIIDARFGNNRGTLSVGYIGADYLLGDSLLVGALVQFDGFSNDHSTLGAGQAEGDGWMAGPYVTARLGERLFVDARVALGRSSNTVSPLGTSVDAFDTERLLGTAAVIGDLPLGGGFTLWPEVELRYLREEIEGYVDNLGVTIPGTEIAHGEVGFSPRLDYRVVSTGGWTLAPYVQAEGIATFTADRFSPVDDGFRARVSFGLDAVSRGALRAGVSGFFDGIGESGYNANGITANISLNF